MRRGYELAVSRARMEAESVARDSLNARLAQFNAYLEVEVLLIVKNLLY